MGLTRIPVITQNSVLFKLLTIVGVVVPGGNVGVVVEVGGAIDDVAFIEETIDDPEDVASKVELSLAVTDWKSRTCVEMSMFVINDDISADDRTVEISSREL